MIKKQHDYTDLLLNREMQMHKVILELCTKEDMEFLKMIKKQLIGIDLLLNRGMQ